MEIAMGLSGASTLVSVAVGSAYYGCRLFQKELSKHKKVLLLIPEGCGKTQLVRTLESNDSSYLVFDIDELIKSCPQVSKDELEKYLDCVKKGDENTSKILFHGLASKCIEFVKANNRTNKKMLFVCGDIELSNVLKNVCVAIPSNRLFEEILKDKPQEKKEHMKRERVKYISSFNPKEMFVFDNFEQLYNNVRERFKLAYHL